MSDRYFDEDRAGPVIEALRAWAASHSTPDQPFFILMSDSRDRASETDPPSRTLTPRQFLHEVEDRTELGTRFLRFVFGQADRYHIPAEAFVWRMVEANKRSDLEPERP